LLGRVAASLPTLILITFAAFYLNTAARGDPAYVALVAAGTEPTVENLKIQREKMGLNDPIPVRYLRWAGNVLQGDFGRSFLDGRPVRNIIRERLAPTLKLGAAAFVTATLAGIVIGVLLGLIAGSPVDILGRFTALFLAAIPSFWLALLLIVYIGERERWLPTGGYGGSRYMILPVIALAAGPTASLMRFTRGATIEVWRQDYVRTARAKGLRQTLVVLRHALPNAMLPILTLLGLRFGQILAGSIIIESIFAWPGMGTALINAISGRDLPVIGTYVLIAGTLFVLVNLLTDVGYVLLDPRVRLGAGTNRGGL
jgi:ABC-type dipeptide/oligopeptide/nickel transport system permease component